MTTKFHYTPTGMARITWGAREETGLLYIAFGNVQLLWKIVGEFLRKLNRGIWVVQWVKHLTLGGSSGLHFKIIRSSSARGSMLSAELA